MVILYKYANSYVIDNTSYIIDNNLLGKVINQWLKDSKELNTSNMSRCDEYCGYIIVCPYGSLSGKDLLWFLRTYLAVNNIPFEYQGELPSELVISLRSKLPNLNGYTGEQSGSSVSDTSELEDGIKPLCDVLNELPFIETFSSCEGHVKNGSGTLYVLFTIEGKDKFNNLNDLSRVLDSSFENIWAKYSTLKGMVIPQFRFGYGHWPGLEHIYFEIRMTYIDHLQDTLFKAIKDISKLIEEELK